MADDNTDDDQVDESVDGSTGPEKEPKSARAWLAMIDEADKAFKTYQDKMDGIDKQYADLERLANASRDRQFQMFWANIQVLGPSIYSRPPIPVVVPRFKDRKPLPRITSELLERSSIVALEQEDIDSVMCDIRDDLVIGARGCAWLRYEASSKDNDFTERVCIDHVDRKDFLHPPVRKWKEVDWCARAAYLGKREMRKRFYKTSGNEYQQASYEVRKDPNNEDDKRVKAKVWEIWHKTLNRVVWVSEGCEKLLDDDAPHLDLEGFFPCPRPAYATKQRRSLIPVPDMVYYKDQLEEINELTARIAALTDAVKVRGFYPGGASDLSDAIETAVKKQSDNQILIPVANWAAMGQGAPKDIIVWLPIDQIASTIVQLVNLRKQLIDDVYQITGLSDIMRGSTEASETLGAQQLKSQYGSIRIRDRQKELVRVALEITRIAAEIMAENFASKTLLDMSQLQIATDADIAKQIDQLEKQIMQIVDQVEKAKTDPQVVAQAQAAPDKAQQALAAAKQQVTGLQQQVAKLKGTPTVEKVMAFLRDQRLRPFVLDIETDSTIAPDENAQKQAANEFLAEVGGFMQKALPEVQQMPQAAPVVAEMLKFVVSQFRAGRQLEGIIDEFADQMAATASQGKGPSPEQQKVQAETAHEQAKMQFEQQTATAKQQAEQQQAQFDHEQAMAKTQATMQGQTVEWNKAILAALAQIEVARIEAKSDVDSTAVSGQLENLLGLAQMDHERRMAGVAPAADGAATDPDASAAAAPSTAPVDPMTALANMLAGHQEANNKQISALIDRIGSVMAAPKVIVRDANNRVVGTQTVMPQQVA